MDAKTRKKIAAVLDEAVELAEQGQDEYDAARVALTAQTSDVYRELAVAAIVDVVRRRKRSNVLEIEREAESKPRPSRTRVPNAEQWVPATPDEAEYHSMGYTHEEYLRNVQSRELGAAIRVATDRYVKQLKIEWTAELLASDIAIPGKGKMRWGDAELDDLKARYAMLIRNAETNAEAAARVLKAIEELERTGARTLGAMVGVAA